MPFIDETWLRKAHQALKQTLEVDSNTRRDMIQFLFDEGFWDEKTLSWDSAVARFNDCNNPTKTQFWKLGELWALMLRFERLQLFHAMAESFGYEVRPLPTEARRIALLERIVANQERFDGQQQELMADLGRLCTAPLEQRLPSMPGTRPQFSLPGEERSAVERIGCP